MKQDIELTQEDKAMDIEMMRGAWCNLVDLTSLISNGCPVYEDDTHTLDSVAYQCKRFLEEYDEYQKRPL